MVALNQLTDNDGARKNRMRVGRGIGSGKGKTCGRGEKGQKSRTGVAIKGFEGGQMPIFRRLPKRGFINIFKIEYQVINIADLQYALDSGKIKAKSVVDKSLLKAIGLINNDRGFVKLLGDGSLSAPVTLHVDKASKSALQSMEAAGAAVVLSQEK
jgi:large subunit ribosomal protein L15